MEPAVLESFLAKVESGIDSRIDARLASRRGRAGGARHPDWSAFALAIVSLGMGVGVVGDASLAGELLAWVAIVLVNLAYNFRR